MRLIVLLIALGHAPGCSRAEPPTGGKMTMRQQVEAAHGSAGSVQGPDALLPGFEIYWVDQSTAPDQDRGYAVLAGPDGLKTGKAAMQAVLAQSRDPHVLAQAARDLLERGGAPLTAPKDGAQRAAGVQAPRLDGDTLTYWADEHATQHPGLYRYRIDLRTLAVTEDQPGQPSPLDHVKRGLAGTPSQAQQALDTLVTLCPDPAALAVLHGQMTGKDEALQQRAVQLVAVTPACRSPQIDATLVTLIAEGPQPVRLAAIRAAKRLKLAAAKAALEAVVASEPDALLKKNAERALKKL